MSKTRKILLDIFWGITIFLALIVFTISVGIKKQEYPVLIKDTTTISIVNRSTNFQIEIGWAVDSILDSQKHFWE